ncbi:MAG: IS21-like element helper ATPase IstB [Pseudomonadota bacterium]
MLNHPTFENLRRLKLTGMLKALQEQGQMPDIDQLGFLERLGLLVDREIQERDNRRLASRLRLAKLKQTACLEDLDLKTPRQLDRSFIQQLADGRWIAQHLNVLITGPTGVGKSFLACALAQKACRQGHTAFYQRLPRLLTELEIARGDGRYPRLMRQLAKVDVLVLDDWGLDSGLNDRQRRDLLEILDDRYASRATVVTSQLPVEHWHEALGDPTLADAILDRLVHNAHRIQLQGKSMRKQAAEALTSDSVTP